ncbi:hypothetical protein E2C01_022399 [Portunus trituberculatus]|uniref:HTH psq-type domain-containing protein n=1 Tax=Portunus trituberculatus TaxID=210409 RepID=A0A5B7E5W2_PORTR|nr:hypothetical protein [Portunus trituberculatus]
MRDRTYHLRCDWLAPCLSLAFLELDPRNFTSVRAISCCEMASMNAWRDDNVVALSRQQRSENINIVVKATHKLKGSQEEEEEAAESLRVSTSSVVDLSSALLFGIPCNPHLMKVHTTKFRNYEGFILLPFARLTNTKLGLTKFYPALLMDNTRTTHSPFKTITAPTRKSLTFEVKLDIIHRHEKGKKTNSIARHHLDSIYCLYYFQVSRLY